MNLCTNAAQAMDTGEGVLTVSLEPTHLDDVDVRNGSAFSPVRSPAESAGHR